MADISSQAPLIPTDSYPATGDTSLSEADSVAAVFLRGLLPASIQARRRVYSALLRSLVNEGVMQ